MTYPRGQNIDPYLRWGKLSKETLTKMEPERGECELYIIFLPISVYGKPTTINYTPFCGVKVLVQQDILHSKGHRHTQ